MGRTKEIKRRDNHSGSIYLCRGRYVVGYINPETGKRTKRALVKLDAFGNEAPITNKTEAEIAAANFLADIKKIAALETKAEVLVKVAETKQLITLSRLKPDTLWERFEKSKERGDCGEATLKKYKTFFSQFLAWLTKRRGKIEDVSAIDRSVAASFMDHLWATGVSEATYNGYRQALRFIFKIVLAGSDTPNPFQEIRKKVEQPQSRREFTPEQVDAIFSQLEPSSPFRMLHKEEMRVLINLCCWTGCRMQDAALMPWHAINFSNNTIRFRPLKTARSSGKLVTIPMHPQLSSALHLAETWRKSGEDILPNVAARYRSVPSNLSKDITRLIESIGLETSIEPPPGIRSKRIAGSRRRVCQYGVHSFRHTFVSFCANAGVPMAIVAEIVGHGNPAMTRHYYHMDRSAAQKAIDTLPQLGSKAGGGIAPLREKLHRLIDGATPEQLERWQEVIDPYTPDLPFEVPAIEAVLSAPAAPLDPTPERLLRLLPEYSIEAIGQIFGLSGTAIRKRMQKYNLAKSPKRVMSGILSAEELASVREKIKMQ